MILCRPTSSSISESAAHRFIDLEIANADASSSISASIVCPGLVHGAGNGPVSRISKQVPDMIQKALNKGAGVYAGEGTNVWANVHVEDVATLVEALLVRYLEGEPIPHRGLGNFFFAAHEKEHTFGDLAAAVGAVLHRNGLISSPEPVSVPVPEPKPGQHGMSPEDYPDIPLWPNRTNTRCRARRGPQELGWTAKTPFDRMGMEKDVSNVVADMKRTGAIQA